ncbi:MAG: HD domain-containing protein, partial [Candidatus Latescibacterota bacterium]
PTPSATAPKPKTSAEPQPDETPVQTRHKPTDETELEYKNQIKELKRSLVQYKWLFSLNADFSAIEDKGQLLDAFLLTTIAQVGVEAAAFLELVNDEFVAQCWKGFETADPHKLNIPRADVDIDQWIESPRILPLEDAPLSDTAKQIVDAWDLPHAAPFVVRNRFRGIVLLGRPIRAELDAKAWEFLGIMISQVAIAYENSCRLETESERTLGLVQSLISMIESNTMSRGTTGLVMDLTYAVAVKMHYPEEHQRDLMYGTVLRDIGMIKTSNLILRSPRELMKEEWEIIKQHPIEGAEILESMGFTEHTREVVMYHHERYNGEGYPCGLAGAQIPLGARILSVVESYGAMLQDRPNRPALSREEAVSTLKENWGIRYDPDIVEIFIDVIEEEIRGTERRRYKVSDLIKE